jgi:hypothetical protein
MSGPIAPEKERIKELCAPVYDWVKTLGVMAAVGLADVYQLHCFFQYQS